MYGTNDNQELQGIIMRSFFSQEMFEKMEARGK